MSRTTVNTICATFPGAQLSDPWGGGHDAWKIGGKLFATMGVVLDSVSIKTDSIETAQMLIEAGVGIKAPYFHRSWINVSWDMNEPELEARIASSYRLIRATLPKKVQVSLGSFH